MSIANFAELFGRAAVNVRRCEGRLEQFECKCSRNDRDNRVGCAVERVAPRAFRCGLKGLRAAGKKRARSDALHRR
jgi:hypothetical protein